MNAHRIRIEKSGGCVAVTKLEARSVSVRYHDQLALHDISLPIHKGWVSPIIGPSGCGKSSFLMALNRLLDLVPEAHVSGKVLLDGEDILDNAINVTSIRRRIGMIFQKTNPFPLSIERNIAPALEHHGITDSALRAEVVEQSLQAVGLWKEIKDKIEF